MGSKKDPEDGGAVAAAVFGAVAVYAVCSIVPPSTRTFGVRYLVTSRNVKLTTF